MPARSILIADDDPLLLAAMTAQLEAHGYTVLAMQDAYQAVSQARTALPDLLILDIGLPAGSGFSVHERIGKFAELAQTPVIYITGLEPERVDQTSRHLGAYAVLHKPFEPGQLIATAREAIETSMVGG